MRFAAGGVGGQVGQVGQVGQGGLAGLGVGVLRKVWVGILDSFL